MPAKELLVPTLICLVFLALAVYVSPGGREPGDNGIKFIQARDLVQNNYQSFQARYKGLPVDPTYKYFPMANLPGYFIHKVGDAYYYVFPIFLTIVIAPLLQLLGVQGPYLITTLPLAGLIFLLWHWSAQLGMRFSTRLATLLLICCGTAMLHYDLILSEYGLALALTNSALFLIWKAIRTDRLALFILAAVPFGLVAFVRQETVLLALLLPANYLLFSFREARVWQAVIAYGLILTAMVAMQFGINYQIFGVPLGLRQLQQMDEMGQGFLQSRLAMFIEIFFYGRFSVGLLAAFPVLLIAAFQYKKARTQSQATNILALAVLGYALLIPLATVTYQGVGWGPRFLLVILPYLLLYAMQLIDGALQQQKHALLKTITYTAIAYSVTGSLIAANLMIFSNRLLQYSHRYIEQHSRPVLIFLQPEMVTSAFGFHDSKYMFTLRNLDDTADLLQRIRRLHQDSVTFIDHRGQLQTKLAELQKKSGNRLQTEQLLNWELRGLGGDLLNARIR
ncbi:MAG: hypothetical protein KDK39_01990 [Leptospiraceae bacterium]|nr:hypothetical protein [Leptospiraceae bacterium]